MYECIQVYLHILSLPSLYGAKHIYNITHIVTAQMILNHKNSVAIGYEPSS